MIKVNRQSSFIKDFTFEKGRGKTVLTGALTVTIRDLAKPWEPEKIYRHEGVTVNDVRVLKNANSVGEVYNRLIKAKYGDGVRIE